MRHRGEDALSVGLPEDDKAQPGRNQIGGQRLQIADERVGNLDAGTRRNSAKDRGVADTLGRTNALLFPPPQAGEGLGGGLRSNSIGERGRAPSRSSPHPSLPRLRGRVRGPILDEWFGPGGAAGGEECVALLSGFEREFGGRPEG